MFRFFNALLNRLAPSPEGYRGKAFINNCQYLDLEQDKFIPVTSNTQMYLYDSNDSPSEHGPYYLGARDIRNRFIHWHRYFPSWDIDQKQFTEKTHLAQMVFPTQLLSDNPLSRQQVSQLFNFDPAETKEEKQKDIEAYLENEREEDSRLGGHRWY